MPTTRTTEVTPVKALRSIVGPDHVRDASAADAVDGVLPGAVVEPASIGEAAAILKACSSGGLTIVPRGGGTKLGWGSRPERVDVILSTGRLDAMLEHASGDLVARVQPG